jgi:KDO2-lipid IV(A) lauroyltransferase
MVKLKYFFQFIIIVFFFSLFKLLGLKISRIVSGFIFSIIGPIFRSNKIADQNLQIAIPNLDQIKRKFIIKNMWINYGKIFSEYMFIKKFRSSEKFSKKVEIKNQEILNDIINQNEPVIFISGHFSNFELMAMQLEKIGVDLAVIYRPLNNIFLNPIMEKIRKKYICKIQVKKGISGTKELLKLYKDKKSIALMIDQRVSEGIKIKLFNNDAFTTTIPAQFFRKFSTKIVPIYIERMPNDVFVMKIIQPIKFNKNDSIEFITLKLNEVLEKMILKNPDQWIWTHNRWK